MSDRDVKARLNHLSHCAAGISSRKHKGWLMDAVQIAEEANARADAATWQPIETAPKDGTYVLLYEPRDDDHAIEVGFYECETWYGMDHIYSIYPTHWMPLPKPPEQTP